MIRRAALAAGLALLVANCAARRDAVAPPLAMPSSLAAPARAADAPLASADLAALPGWAAADFAPALAAFRASCRSLVRRADPSGLTVPEEWRPACAAAATAGDPRGLFAEHFTPVVIAGGTGRVTGYFEPELAGSRTPAPGFATPFYRVPPDLMTIALGDFDPALAGRTLRGRVVGGRFVPYFDRAAIDGGALAGRGLELAFAADPHAAFFLEVQGSGRLRLPDGSVMRIGYAGQNGQPYVAIGKLLRERDLLAPGQATMAGIIAWLRAQPDGGQALMQENRSKIFFREVTGGQPGDGPIGALNIPLRARASVAADPRFVPLGAPLWLAVQTPDGSSFAAPVVAQDVGGAIRGANRLDLFFGSGDAAGALAGAMLAEGRVTLLLPHAAAARLLRGTPPARP